MGEAKGRFFGTPSVDLMPYTPPLFCCGAIACFGKIGDKREAVNKWIKGCGATYVKLKPYKCDHCFLLTEKVHRSDLILLVWSSIFLSQVLKMPDQELLLQGFQE